MCFHKEYAENSANCGAEAEADNGARRIEVTRLKFTLFHGAIAQRREAADQHEN
jgi:hypothetical protein